MSAFVGLLKLDGVPASLPTATAMLDRLRHRVDEEGWNARQVRATGPVALGSAVLNSTPQAQFECQNPDAALSLETPNATTLRFAGDVRLDTRDELLQLLELSGSQVQGWSDSRLVLEAYARFGCETPRHLKGDFAFAIWDEARQKLFCARDRFGVRPFYFAFVPGQVLAFANEIKALWPALPFAPRPDQTHIADYLAGNFDSFTRTFYEGVERLPPAHSLTLDLAKPTTQQASYFTLDRDSELRLGSDADYAAELRATFERAINERTQCPGQVGVFLSGGLDSSAVAAVATRQTPAEKPPLIALSMVYDRFKQCDERQWIESNLKAAQGKLEKEWIWGDDIGALNDVERVVWHLDGPPPGPNTCAAWAQYAPLKKLGVCVVLDGHGGDEVVCMGYSRISELIRERRFGEARRELLLLRRHGLAHASATPLFWAHLGQRASGTRFIGRFMRSLTRSVYARAARRTNSAPPSETEEGFAIVKELVCAEKRSLLPMPSSSSEDSVRGDHANDLSSPLQPMALEAMDALAGAHAMEVRVPFWEENMVTLCLSLPSDQKMRDGWNRWVMRRAMQNLLPPDVQWRSAKTNFASQMIWGLCHIERDRIESQLQNPGILTQWLDISHARVLWEELQKLPLDSTRAAHIAFALWRFMILGVWLRGYNTPDSKPK
ncbi:hypothetical protein EON83_18015 [bacterium]|nr:MAG: hypothetical protein EON83_18015 [bacterium]